MPNSWRVIWFENNQKFKKSGFAGDSPKASGAIDYAKSVAARGILVSNIHVVSMRKTFAPTQKMLKEQPPGTFWCPWCIKWREFTTFAVVRNGEEGIELLRCPICTISTNDFFIKKYNPILVARAQARVPRLPSVKTLKRRRR